MLWVMTGKNIAVCFTHLGLSCRHDTPLGGFQNTMAAEHRISYYFTVE